MKELQVAVTFRFLSEVKKTKSFLPRIAPCSDWLLKPGNAEISLILIFAKTGVRNENG